MEFGKFERKTGDGWETVEFELIKVGDVIRKLTDGEVVAIVKVTTAPEPCIPVGNMILNGDAV